jgi:hypothetical protein
MEPRDVAPGSDVESQWFDVVGRVSQDVHAAQVGEKP